MKVRLLSAYPLSSAISVPEWLMKHGNLGNHQLVEDPAEADLIIFAETFEGLDPFFLDVIRHPVFRRFPNKSVLYHISDVTQTLCRTISPSIDRYRSNVHCRRSFSYVVRGHDNPYLDQMELKDVSRRYLFSFVGDPRTHPIRLRLLALNHAEALLEAVAGSSASLMSESDRKPFQKRYLQTILESDFVLCPRGWSPASMRLFEVMQMGRAPVIISDSWLPVSDVPWDECALFVDENTVELIPEILEAHRYRAAEMGRRAREIWEEHFAPDKTLCGLIKSAGDLLQVPYGVRERFSDSLELISPCHWRNLLGYAKRQVLSFIHRNHAA